jgi:Integrase zinc binding domain/Chromo (CHRromatin Organisation MOdifier) domain
VQVTEAQLQLLSPMELAVHKAYSADPVFKDTALTKRFQYVQGMWLDGHGKIVVPDDAAVRQAIISEHHDTPFSAHQGVQRTYKAISSRYWWKGLKAAVHAYVGVCHSCQQMKPGNTAPAGLLQPLPIPDRPWASISVDFITGLPPSGEQKFDTITVFVDRLTKMVHYVPCHVKLSAENFADLFVQNIFRLHGLPLQIVSDRDPRFTSQFWREVMGALGTKLSFSTAFHPQTDGQTERMNRSLEEMLRHFITPMRGDWGKYLPILEFASNNAHNHSIGTTPFRLYTGLAPLCPSSTLSERTYKVPSAKQFTEHMTAEMARAKQCLADAQARQKAYADKHRSDVTFSVGDQVLLSTKNLSLKGDDPRKLWPKYVGPFSIVQVVGKVAYKLQLPDHMHIHNVFHVSLLKQYRSDGGYHPPPPTLVDGEEEYVVSNITAHKVQQVGGRHNRRPRVHFLVSWTGYGREHDSWEPGVNLQDCSALEEYLQQLVRHNEELPPGYRPEGTTGSRSTAARRAA